METKVLAIQDFPCPITQCKLCEFLELVNFYRCFIPQQLDTLLKHTKRPSNTLRWTDNATETFRNIKIAFASASLLVNPAPDDPTNVMTDASAVAVGAVLQQYTNGQWCPLSYFYRAMKPAEQWYSTYDSELLSIFLAIKHFCYFLEGRHFYIITDHKPLTYAFSTRLDRHSPRQIRQLNFISQFTTDLCHVQGSANAAVDALSCIGANTQHTGQPSPSCGLPGTSLGTGG